MDNMMFVDVFALVRMRDLLRFVAKHSIPEY